MPVAVEAIPPKPNTAAISAITRNISAQYNIAESSEFDSQRACGEEGCRVRPATPAAQAAFCPEAPETRARENSMRRELTTTQARSGVVSGRVITVLLVSFVGACVALGLAWFLLTK